MQALHSYAGRFVKKDVQRSCYSSEGTDVWHTVEARTAEKRMAVQELTEPNLSNQTNSGLRLKECGGRLQGGGGTTVLTAIARYTTAHAGEVL